MEYLVEFITTIPDHAPPAEIEQSQASETTRIAELAAQGTRPARLEAAGGLGDGAGQAPQRSGAVGGLSGRTRKDPR